MTIGTNNGTSTFGGTIQDGGGTMALVKTGNGVFTLSGPSTYSGGTTVAAGKLYVTGSLLARATSRSPRPPPLAAPARSAT